MTLTQQDPLQAFSINTFSPFFLFLLFTTVLSQWDFSNRTFGLPSLGKASCDSHTTQTGVHARCYSVSIIHQTLIWTTGSLMCTQMCMYVTAHGGCTDTAKESALKDDSGRKISCRTGQSNLHWQHASIILYHLSYISTPAIKPD